MARYVPGQRSFVARVDARGRITIPKPVRDALGWQAGDEIVVRTEGGAAILSKRGELHGHNLEETLEALAGVRSRLRGGGLDAVAVVRKGRDELECQSWVALSSWDDVLGRGSKGVPTIGDPRNRREHTTAGRRTPALTGQPALAELPGRQAHRYEFPLQIAV